jgi:hypothetical protein
MELQTHSSECDSAQDPQPMAASQLHAFAGFQHALNPPTLAFLHWRTPIARSARAVALPPIATALIARSVDALKQLREISGLADRRLAINYN